ncbi:MAG: 50S ribosomal protein L32 [Rhodobacteraceae bacterium]|nr:50S ribosomal protein L32 [Paracoccaceae bacterium]
MAVQQNKVSRARRNNRRSHDAIVAKHLRECESCGEMKRPHHICLNPQCGMYRGNQVLSSDTDDIEEE